MYSVDVVLGRHVIHQTRCLGTVDAAEPVILICRILIQIISPFSVESVEFVGPAL